MLLEPAQHADVGESARASAAERDAHAQPRPRLPRRHRAGLGVNAASGQRRYECRDKGLAEDAPRSV